MFGAGVSTKLLSFRCPAAPRAWTGRSKQDRTLIGMAAEKRVKPDDAVERATEVKQPKTRLTLAPLSGKLLPHKPSILYRVGKRKGIDKIAAFDLDGTLVQWKPGRTFSLHPDSWLWFNSTVPTKLKEYHNKGYRLVIFTNQAIIKSALTGKGATDFNAKINAILNAASVDATVCAATMKDGNRKPALGMWHFFLDKCNDGNGINLEASFYVGDAAGRLGDHSADDKNFAAAIGLPFKLPEDCFGPGDVAR